MFFAVTPSCRYAASLVTAALLTHASLILAQIGDFPAPNRNGCRIVAELEGFIITRCPDTPTTSTTEPPTTAAITTTPAQTSQHTLRGEGTTSGLEANRSQTVPPTTTQQNVSFSWKTLAEIERAVADLEKLREDVTLQLAATDRTLKILDMKEPNASHEDIVSVTNILNSTTSVLNFSNSEAGGTTDQIVQTTLLVISKVAQANFQAITTAQRLFNTSSKLIQIIECIGTARAIDVTDKVQTLRTITHSLLLIDVSNLDNSTNSSVVFELGTGNLLKASHDVRLTDELPSSIFTEARTHGMHSDMSAMVILPLSALKKAKLVEQKRNAVLLEAESSSDNITMATESPIQVTAASNVQRVQFSVYSNDNLFQETHLGPGVVPRKTVISFVIGARVGDVESLPLGDEVDEGVTLVFTPTIAETASRQYRCVFWNFTANAELGGWNNGGCNRIAGPARKVSCRCSHLTNFAVLLSRTSASSSTNKALDIISKIGIALSIFGLVLTIFTFILVGAPTNEPRSAALLGLSIHLLALLILFIVGVEKTSDHSVCKAVAILLHYLILTVFMWSAVEAYLLYRNILLIFNTSITHFIGKAILFAEGVPAVIVTFSAGLAWDDYSGKDFCRLNAQVPFYVALITPMSIILTGNLTVFLAVWRKLHNRNSSGAVRSIKASGAMEKRRNFRSSIGLTLLLGVTWITGLGLLENNITALQVIFAILVTTQGFAIFIFQVALSPAKKSLLWLKLSGQRKKILTSTNTNLSSVTIISRPRKKTSSDSSKSDSHHFSA